MMELQNDPSAEHEADEDKNLKQQIDEPTIQEVNS